MASKAFRDTGVHSLGRAMHSAACTCGRGVQTREHVLLFCPEADEERAAVRTAMERAQVVMCADAAHPQWSRTLTVLQDPEAAAATRRTEAVACLLGMVEPSAADGPALTRLLVTVLKGVAQSTVEKLTS